MSWKHRIVLGTAASVLMVTGCAGPRPLPYVQQLGDEAAAKGDHETATKEYKEYVQRKPIAAKVRYKLGVELMALGRFAEAREHLDVALERYPDDDAWVETLAECLFQGKESEDLYTFLHARCDRDQRVDDYLRLGRFAQRNGDVDAALTAFRTAAEVDRGQNLGPQLALASLHASVGNREDAIRRLRMALYIDQANEVVRQRLRDLGEVPGPSLILKPAEAPAITFETEGAE